MSRVIDSVAFNFLRFVCLVVCCPLDLILNGFGLGIGFLIFVLRTRGLLKYLKESKEGLFQEVLRIMIILDLDFGFQQTEDS